MKPLADCAEEIFYSIEKNAASHIQHQHVTNHEECPAPRVGFAPDNRNGRHALRHFSFVLS